MSNNDSNKSTEQLLSMLEFDPSKEPKLEQDAFKEVLGELKAKRSDEAKVKARDLLGKAMELRKQQMKAKKEFERQEQNFEKELSKLVKQVKNMLNGAEQTPDLPEETPVQQ